MNNWLVVNISIWILAVAIIINTKTIYDLAKDLKKND